MTVMGRIRSIPSWQLTLGVALLGLGFLVAAQLAAQGPRVRYTTQERAPLVETATQLQAQQEELKASILELREQIQAMEGSGEGSAAVVKDLNDQLEAARIAAGLIPLTGTGIVLQLEDSLEPVAAGRQRGRLPRRRRGTCAPSSRSCGWPVPRRSRSTANASRRRAPSSISGRPCSSTRPISRRRTRSPRSDRATCTRQLAASPGFVDFVRARAESYGVRVSFAEPESVDIPAFAGTVVAALRATGGVAGAVAVGGVGPCTSDATSSPSRPSPSCSACSWSSSFGRRPSGAAFAGLSSQDLTVLVANLNDRNDQLRREIATLERRSRDPCPEHGAGRRLDRRVCVPTCAACGCTRASMPSTGPGVVIAVRGPIDGSGVEDLVNELRNAGAEAIGLAGARVVPGVVVTGAAGSAAIGGTALDDPFELIAIGAAGQAHGVVDPLGRDHRPARGDPTRCRRGGHAGRSPRRARHGPGARAGQRPAAPLIPCPPCRPDPS